MAATQYQIFCRYYNSSINKVVTNQTKALWISAEEFTTISEIWKNPAQKAQYDTLVSDLRDGTRRITDFTMAEQSLYNTCQKYEEYLKMDAKELAALEIVIIEPADSLYQDTQGTKKKAKMARDLAMYDILVEQTDVSNPKYDMIFMYDGLAKTESEIVDYNPPTNDKRQAPYVYYDRMRRFEFDPWFFHSTHASLTSAMTKAKELINVLGKDSVQIGKVVPLDKYIEIV